MEMATMHLQKRRRTAGDSCSQDNAAAKSHAHVRRQLCKAMPSDKISIPTPASAHMGKQCPRSFYLALPPHQNTLHGDIL